MLYSGIYNFDKGILWEGADYYRTDNEFTIYGEYLSKLSYGEIIFKLVGQNLYATTFYINVVDSRDPELANNMEFSIDRYDVEKISFSGKLYDSCISKITAAGKEYYKGFSNTTTGVTINSLILKSLPLGDQVLTIYFNDSSVTYDIVVHVSDTGLYFDDARIDLAEYVGSNANAYFKATWTLYQGYVESASFAKLPSGAEKAPESAGGNGSTRFTGRLQGQTSHTASIVTMSLQTTTSSEERSPFMIPESRRRPRAGTSMTKRIAPTNFSAPIILTRMFTSR